MLTKLTVVYGLHNDVCCNEIGFVAVANKHAGVTVFIDKTRSAISGI